MFSTVKLSSSLTYCSLLTTLLLSLPIRNGYALNIDDLNKLLEEYSKTKIQRPGDEYSELLIVTLDLEVTEISNIDEVNMEFTMTVFLQQQWTDPRLQYDAEKLGLAHKPLKLHGTQLNNIWQPDTYFVNFRSGKEHSITDVNGVAYIWPNGSVFYSQRLTLTLTCLMDLMRFPMDKQSCNIDISSYGYRKGELEYFWTMSKDPLILHTPIKIAKYFITGQSTSECNGSYTETGIRSDFTCLRGTVHLQRNFTPYLVIIYIPTTLTVLMSFVNFYLSIDLVAGRIGLCVTMTLNNITLGLKSAATDFSRASDIWCLVCMFFVVLSFIEIAVASYLHSVHVTKQKLLTVVKSFDTKPKRHASDSFLNAQARSAIGKRRTSSQSDLPTLPAGNIRAVTEVKVEEEEVVALQNDFKREHLQDRRKSYLEHLPSPMYWHNCTMPVRLRLQFYNSVLVLAMSSVLWPRPVESITVDELKKMHTAYLDTKLQRPGADIYVKLQVAFDIQITELSNIDDMSMQFSVSMFLRQSWRDPRLRYDAALFAGGSFMTLFGDDTDSIWLPDTYFINFKSGSDHRITRPNRVVEIFPNGTIRYSQRLTLTLGCNMDVTRYPMDKQSCSIDISSYGHRINDLEYVWAEEDRAMVLSIPENLPDFHILNHNTSICTFNKTGTFGYNCLRGTLYLQRKFLPFLMRIYIPTTLIVLMSFVNFFLGIELVAARISLCVIMVLNTLTIGLGRSTFGFNRASDVWCVVCLFIVCLSFVEIAVAYFLHTQQLMEKKLLDYANRPSIQAAASVPPPKDPVPDDDDTTPPEIVPVEAQPDVTVVVDAAARAKIINWKRKIGGKVDKRKIPSYLYWSSWWSKVKTSPSMQLDLTCRVVFPLAFVVFIVLYVIVYVGALSD